MKQWQRIAMAAALTAATAAGAAFAGTSANPASTRSAGQPAAASAHGRGPESANIRVIEAFLRDVLDGHHGDHAANYLTQDAQFHARHSRRLHRPRHRRRDPGQRGGRDP